MRSIEDIMKWWTLILLALTAVACGTGVSGDLSAERSENTDSETSAETSLLEESGTSTSPDAKTFFPQQAPRTDYGMADLRGRLVLDDEGCIRVVGQGVPRMLVWPAGFELSVKGDRVRILDGKSRLVGQVGKKVELGGAEDSQEIIEQNGLKNNRMLPELFERCPGEYWLVADI